MSSVTTQTEETRGSIDSMPPSYNEKGRTTKKSGRRTKNKMSLMNFADKMGELTLEWFSCQADNFRRIRERRRRKGRQEPEYIEEMEEHGMELDESALLRATYQLYRV